MNQISKLMGPTRQFIHKLMKTYGEGESILAKKRLGSSSILSSVDEIILYSTYS